MSKLTALKSANTREDVATLLQTSKQGLASILFSRPIAGRYVTFEIPKKHGGSRAIKAPDDKLKLLQKKLSILLQDCLAEMESAKGYKPVAHGFKRDRSIVTNARQHRNRRWVFNLDLQDFFPSINFGRVRGFFIKDRNFLLNKNVATVLAQIACDGAALPQGSPCSPVISNLITHVLDIHLVRLATKAGCTYTRYADDLTFSTNKREFPKEIAYQPDVVSVVWSPGKQLQETITHSDFKINPGKTRMQYRDSRQDVTGLVVNRKVNIRCEYRHRVRAMVHRLFRTGAFQITGTTHEDGTHALETRNGTLNELHGMLGFIDGIDLHNQKKVAGKNDSTPLATKESMYRQFLLYKDFYAAEAPVILCEGKTDNVYLKYAMRSLAREFPALAAVDDKGKVTLKVRLYPYTKTSTGRILGLKEGGTGTLGKFIGRYRQGTCKFKAPGLVNPIIIVFDNDSGRGAILSAAKEARSGKKEIDINAPFSHIVKNLYIVPTPISPGAAESMIEDFFSADLKRTSFKGKSFTTENKFDRSTHYGKNDFAELVKAQANSIDFSGFLPLLQNIASAIEHHSAKAPGVEQAAP